MLMLARPVTQDHLNASVLEVINLNVMGPVGIPGEWDADDTIRYIEAKTKTTLQSVPIENGIHFFINDKRVKFTQFRVTIQPTGDHELHAPASSSHKPLHRR